MLGYVKTDAQEICGISIIGGLVGVGVPVAGQLGNRILVHIDALSAFGRKRSGKGHAEHQHEGQKFLHGVFSPFKNFYHQLLQAIYDQSPS